MVTEITFVGWDRPILHGVADFLQQKRFFQEAVGIERELWNLSEIVVICPTSRAGRRLMDILAQRAMDPARPVALLPPLVTSPAGLPHAVLETGSRCANAAEVITAWASALQKADVEKLARHVGRQLLESRLRVWTLARRLAAVHTELVVEGLSLRAVAEHTKGSSDEAEHERWQTFAEIEDTYLELLSEVGLVDPPAVAGQGTPRLEGVREVVLAGLAEVPATFRQALHTLPIPVHILVGAPASEASAFDSFGCIHVQAWSDRLVPISDDLLELAEDPKDAAMTTLSFVHRLSADLGPDEFSIAYGDRSLQPALRRVLEAAGVPSHVAVGRAGAQTRPVQLLRCLAEYLGGEEVEALATLLRHPDIALSLGTNARIAPALRQLDTFRKDHLPQHLGLRLGYTPAPPSHVDHVLQYLRDLCDPLLKGQQPVHEWGDALAQVLTRLYENHNLTRRDSETNELLDSLNMAAEVVREMATVHPKLGGLMLLNGSEALGAFCLLASPRTVAEADTAPAVELLDWYELPADDAPAKIVVGLHEGAIPEPQSGEPLLSDKLRTELGLPNSQQRYARDAYYLTNIIHSTPHLSLIVSKTSSDGQPLTPSRLLFACRPDVLSHRARRIFASGRPEAAPVQVLFKPGPHLCYSLIRPNAQVPIRHELPVTAFRDYLTCPYRFYLKHILKLESVDDRAVEMGPDSFGSVLHAVIKEFCKEDGGQTMDEDRAFRRLCELLDRVATEQFGNKRPVAVELQLQHMRVRLRRFAQWHVTRLQNDWQIRPEWIEHPCALELQVGDQPFIVRGRIDRIEQNRKTGEYVILDLKSSDTEADPEKQHRCTVSGQREWCDLQLPLYRFMFHPSDDGPVRLGFLWLSPDRDKEMLRLASWTEAEMNEALQCAQDVVKRICQREFWPPAEPPRFDDGLGPLCLDHIPDRTRLIQGPPAPWDTSQ